MRPIKTFADAQAALVDLENKVTAFGIAADGLADFKQRRLTNVSPSVDRNDVVIRAELTKAIEQKAVTQQGGLFWAASFGLAVNTDIAIGDDITPRHIAMYPLGGGSDKSATMKVIGSVITQPPVGTSIKVDIIRNFGEVSATKICTIERLENIDDVQTSTTFDDTQLSDGDTLTASVTQVGSVIPGGTLYIKITYVWQ